MNPKKILIVDDSLDMWHLLSTILKVHDFQPIWAADGVQAIAAARFHQPSAILLDIGMPGGDGFLVLQRLKNNCFVNHIPVIVVTACDRQAAEEQTKRLGAVGYLEKPIQADALIASLRTVLPPYGPPDSGAANAG